MEKDILKLDEKINIIFSLQQGRMLPLFPGVSDGRNHWISAGDDLRGLSGADSLFIAKVLLWFAEESNAAVLSGEWGKAKEIIGMIRIYQKAKGGAIQISDSRIHAELLYNKIIKSISVEVSVENINSFGLYNFWGIDFWYCFTMVYLRAGTLGECI